MIEMARFVTREPAIQVDLWDTPEYPINEIDRLFRNVRGEIILPIAELFCNGDEEMKSINYFAMSSKRSYNSDTTREHICRYLNYFEKFYDPDKELLMTIYHIKFAIDNFPRYSVENFMDDVNRFIIRNPRLSNKIERFVDDNYNMNLKSNNNYKTQNLQFEDKHAKILYEVSLLMDMYIPLVAHFMYLNGISKSEDIRKYMLYLFDLCEIKYKEERNVDIYNKIYEIALNVTDKSKGPDKILWEKNLIRGENPTTHTKHSVIDIILNIIPKYSYEKNIINFNYFSYRQSLRYAITDVKYEFPFTKLSSSKRDQDNNSEFDRFEANLLKRNEALAMQNRVAAEETVARIEALYGPFTPEEMEHYRKKLTKDGQPIMNPLQFKLVNYLYARYFGDPVTINAIKNQSDYIKLIIAAKRILSNSGMVILPYIFSSKVLSIASRKIIPKNDQIAIQNAELYNQLVNKYKNPKIIQKIWEFIGPIVSSQFEIIEFDNETKQPTDIDGRIVPMVNTLLNEELMYFIAMI